MFAQKFRIVSVYRQVISAYCAIIIAFSSPAFSEDTKVTLEDLDAIVTKAKNLGEFLESPAIQNEYFTALQNYFGEDRFSREAFDKIIGQLKDVHGKFPEVAHRAWQTTGLGKSFQIELQLKSSGLRLKQDKFLGWLDSWKKALRDQISSQESDLSKKIDQLQREIARHNEEVSRLSRKVRTQRSGMFFRELIKRRDFKEIASAALLERVDLESVNDFLRSGDADLVLSTFEKLKRGTDFTVNGKKLPSELQSLIGRELPKLPTPPLEVVNGQGAETDLFQAETIRTRRGRLIPRGRGSQTVFEVRPIPRRIHGIFKGVPLNECVGGDCTTLDSLTPERWATVFLEDTQFYHVERLSDAGRSYEGFTQLVPGKIGDIRYASADLGSPLFGKKVVSPDGSVVSHGWSFTV